MDNEENLKNALQDAKPSDIEASSESPETSLEEPNSEQAASTSVCANETTSDLTETSSTNTSAKSNKIIAFLKSKIGICVMAAILIVGVLAFVFIKNTPMRGTTRKTLKSSL